MITLCFTRERGQWWSSTANINFNRETHHQGAHQQPDPVHSSYITNDSWAFSLFLRGRNSFSPLDIFLPYIAQHMESRLRKELCPLKRNGVPWWGGIKEAILKSPNIEWRFDLEQIWEQFTAWCFGPDHIQSHHLSISSKYTQDTVISIWNNQSLEINIISL